MKFVIISQECDGMSMAHRLAGEGNEVILWNAEKGADELGLGFDIKRLSKTNIDLIDVVRKNKDAFFIFDGSEYGQTQDKLRKAGYKVIGSSSLGDKVEKDRMYGVELAKELKVKVPETIEVDSVKSAITYIKKNPKKYILKQTGNLPKTLNYKAYKDDSSDIILHLLTQQENLGDKLNGKMVLQEYIEGFEVACSGLFAGDRWVTQKGEVLLEINYENKELLEGGRGITTGETGTIAKFVTGENEIFKMIKPLEKKLKEINHWGMVDANCIYDGKDLWLLEWTIRMGYPIINLYIELCNTNFSQFFIDWWEKKEVSMNTDWGVVLLLAFPLYPYEESSSLKDSYKGKVIDVDDLSEEEQDHVHLIGVNQKEMQGTQLVIAGVSGYALVVTAQDKDYKVANDKCVKIIEKIIPSKKGFYRTDIAKIDKERIDKTLKITNL